MKKTIAFLLSLLLVVPVAAFTLERNTDQPYEGTMETCYSTQTTRTYTHEDYIPSKITYQEGNYAGTLYYDSHYHANYKVYALFKGVVCDGPGASSYEVEK